MMSGVMTNRSQLALSVGLGIGLAFGLHYFLRYRRTTKESTPCRFLSDHTLPKDGGNINCHGIKFGPGAVYVKDPVEYAGKRAKLIKDGCECLQVISDFDSTLTHPQSHSSWSIMEQTELLSEAYKAETNRLYMKYHAYEVDMSLSLAEKSAYMVEWWDNAHALLMKQDLTEEKINAMVEAVEDKIRFRDNCKQTFDFLDAKKIPFLIFSAGIGNFITLMLAHHGFVRDNVHVISNILAFDRGTKRCTGFSTPCIHVFNKSEVNVKAEPYYNEILHRRNVLLMGDSLGDVGMSAGVGHDCVLKVGYLNTSSFQTLTKDRLETYMDTFDVVLVGDGTMQYVNDLLEEMIKVEVR